MKKILTVSIILFVFISCSNKNQKFEFYDGHLRIFTPKKWILVTDDDTKQIESPDKKVTISLTLFGHPSTSHSNFQKDRFEAVDKSIWKEIDLKLNFKSDYELSCRTYINNDNKLYYIVLPISTNQKFLSFTYIIDKNIFDQYRNNLIEIVERIKIF